MTKKVELQAVEMKEGPITDDTHRVLVDGEIVGRLFRQSSIPALVRAQFEPSADLVYYLTESGSDRMSERNIKSIRANLMMWQHILWLFVNYP